MAQAPTKFVSILNDANVRREFTANGWSADQVSALTPSHRIDGPAGLLCGQTLGDGGISKLILALASSG
jgi:hypothetical protein